MNLERFEDREKYPQNTQGVLKAMTELGVHAQKPLIKTQVAEQFVHDGGTPLCLAQFLRELQLCYPRSPGRALGQLEHHIGENQWRDVWNNLEAKRRAQAPEHHQDQQERAVEQERRDSAEYREHRRRALAWSRAFHEAWPLDRLLAEADADETWLRQVLGEAREERLARFDQEAAKAPERAESPDEAARFTHEAEQRARRFARQFQAMEVRLGLRKDPPPNWGKDRVLSC